MIATTTSPCLSEQELSDFSSGRLPESRFELLLAHLDGCERCQCRVESFAAAADSFVQVLSERDRGDHALDDPDSILTELDCQAALYHAVASSPRPLDRVLPPIEMLGPYRLIRPLGRGGMGAVYLAEHERLRRLCAIKLLPKERGLDADWLERFEREMQAIASIQHPHLISATDAGEAAGWHYLVMEYLDGLDLADLVRRLGPLATEAATAIMHDVCEALSALHDAGLVHRDVKPSNVMLTRDGKVKLLDLGLVLDGQSAADMRLTTVGHVLGTLAFAAPEQLSHHTPVGPQADLYGVGATLFQLITGEPSHSSQHGIGPLVLEKTGQPARTMQSVRADVSLELNSLVAQLLQRDPAARPRSAEEVATALQPFANHSSLKPLARRGLRTADQHESAELPVTGWMAFANSPPRKRVGAWGWWLSGLAASVLAAIVMYVQTDRGTLVIESPRDDLQVEILRGDDAVDSLDIATGKTQTTLRSGRYTVRLAGESDGVQLSDSTVAIMRGDEVVVTVREQQAGADTVPQPDAVAAERANKIYKGEPLSHWIELLRVERDVATLSDAMDAVASLADADDVDAAHEILVTTRRFGGSNATSEGDQSEQFMQRFPVAFARLMPSPGIEAITRELPMGNDRSRAACAWILGDFDRRSSDTDSLFGWSGDSKNQPTAKALHSAIMTTLNADEVDNWKTALELRETGIELALQLDQPLNADSGLVEYLTSAAEKYSELVGPDRTLRLAMLKNRLVAFRDPSRVANLNHFNSLEVIAAIKLGIKMDASVAVPSLLSFDAKKIANRYQDERDAALRYSLSKDPVVSSDECLIWLSTIWLGTIKNPNALLVRPDWARIAKLSFVSTRLWTDILPIIAEHTSAPELAIRLLDRVEVERDSLPPELAEVVKSASAIAHQRLVVSRTSLTKDELRKIPLPKTAFPTIQVESPDSCRIAFSGSFLMPGDITLKGLLDFNRVSGETTLLADERSGEVRSTDVLVWSPDSSQIAFIETDHSSKMKIVDVVSGKIDDTGVIAVDVAWSPDGRSIAVSSKFTRRTFSYKGSIVGGRIAVWDIQQRTLTTISPPGRFGIDRVEKTLVYIGGIKPQFSPDGNWIAWHQFLLTVGNTGPIAEQSSVWFAWRDGSGLTRAFEQADEIAWSDDGQSLISLATDERFDVPSPDAPRSQTVPDTWPQLPKSAVDGEPQVQ